MILMIFLSVVELPGQNTGNWERADKAYKDGHCELAVDLYQQTYILQFPEKLKKLTPLQIARVTLKKGLLSMSRRMNGL